jgi:hypothetical protein
VRVGGEQLLGAAADVRPAVGGAEQGLQRLRGAVGGDPVVQQRDGEEVLGEPAGGRVRVDADQPPHQVGRVVGRCPADGGECGQVHVVAVVHRPALDRPELSVPAGKIKAGGPSGGDLCEACGRVRRVGERTAQGGGEGGARGGEGRPAGVRGQGQLGVAVADVGRALADRRPPPTGGAGDQEDAVGRFPEQPVQVAPGHQVRVVHHPDVGGGGEVPGQPRLADARRAVQQEHGPRLPVVQPPGEGFEFVHTPLERHHLAPRVEQLTERKDAVHPAHSAGMPAPRSGDRR